jgi:hypothetical protein
MIKRIWYNQVVRNGLFPLWWLVAAFLCFWLAQFPYLAASGEEAQKTITIEGIQQEIAQLQPPVDAEKISAIQSAIMLQSDEAQEFLSTLLNSRVDEIAQAESELAALGSDQGVEEMIRDKIYSLNFSLNATVEEFRARDEVVGLIAGVRDPKLRYELLKELDKKEQEEKEFERKTQLEN